jgi:cell division initiation protein
LRPILHQKDMRLSPLDIRQHRFQTRFRGFDPEEVHVFLEAIVSDFEEVVRENAQLRRESERLGREVERLRGRERTIQETLTTAQQVVDQLKHTAIRESEVIVSEAQIQAEKTRREAQIQRSQLQREIIELEQLRERAEAEVRRALEDFLSMLGAYREARSRDPRRLSGLSAGEGQSHTAPSSRETPSTERADEPPSQAEVPANGGAALSEETEPALAPPAREPLASTPTPTPPSQPE